MLGGVPFIHDYIVRFDEERATNRHGVSGVHREIEEDLFDLARVGKDAAE